MLDERMWQNVIQDLNPTESRKIQLPLHIHLIYSPLIYAHLIYEVHSADSETDKGALQQPE